MNSILAGYANSAASTSAANYIAALSFGLGGYTATETNRMAVFPVTTTIDNFYVELATAPGSGTSYTYVVRKNQVDTGLSVAIADTNTSGVITGSVSFSAGDIITISCTPANTPASVARSWWSLSAATSDASQPILGGASGQPSTSVTNYQNIYGATNAGWVTTEAPFEVVMPCNGTISNFYMHLSSATAASNGYTFTVQYNGSNSGVIVTIQNGAQNGNDTVDTQAVSAGDTISLRCDPIGTPSGKSTAWGFVFTPSTAGDSVILFGSSAIPSAVANSFENIGSSANGNWNATEANRQNVYQVATVKNMYVLLGTPPGVGSSRIITLQQAGSSSGLAVTISDLSTTGNAASNVTFSANQRIGLKSSVSGGPAADTGGIHLGMTVTVPSTATTLLPFRLMQGIGF